MKININGEEFFRVTSHFGQQEAFRTRPHTGIDLALIDGTPILSPVNAVVESVVNYGDYNIGKGVILTLDDGNRLIFGHLSEQLVKVGDKVSIGEKIALSGNSGFSTGSHLHLGLRSPDGTFLDPSFYIDIIQYISAEMLDIMYKTTSFIIDYVIYFM